MRWLRKKRVLLLLLISFLSLLFLTSNWMSLLYPIHYKDEIRKHASYYDVDPFLVASIIRVETNFKPGKESKKGALGIMQLMPDTANWAMEMAKLPASSLDNVKHEVDVNIQLGTWYIRNLYQQMDGNPIAAIAAYNAGPGNVKNWLSKGTWDGSYENVKSIPFGETRHYVQRVIYYYNQYTSIYDEF
ncbi:MULTISPECIES: lytic transglycosylase domain-containing protein [Paenibacillus]|uniref:Lytic transglycosylase n=1 Tax=Paenibacillus campinasensis TaxID=66347 RepID=A0A268F1H5_9BACL|nr:MULTISPECIES: lytic transglycosylase domain-containing protein [Paenibacillus]MUG65743.1 transglycosylase SLT domain-containing protein [Paenibacillus campinasensis]PAD79220.1 lytic transglycosylase [Paenibacillus campinasensis]PAK54214.1 lytic transglycosylase [Paenibacillus sp. 7541]